jgi:hypothetical protein
MAWFVPSDLEARLSPQELRQLSTGDGRATAPSLPVLQGVLDRAEAEVRGVLAGKGILPDVLPSGLLREVTLDLAVEGLFLRQPGAAAKLPEGWVVRLKQSRVQLDRMVLGEIPVPTIPMLRRLAVVDQPSRVDGAFQ